MHNRMPRSSKAKTRIAACVTGLFFCMTGLLAWSGEIRIESGEGEDTLITVTPSASTINPGSTIIESDENEDTVMEANPPNAPENSLQPLIITPEIRVREHEPWPHRHSSGNP